MQAVGAPFSREELANMSDADFFKAKQAYTLEDMKNKNTTHQTLLREQHEDVRNAAKIRADAINTTTADSTAKGVMSGNQMLGDLPGGRGDKGLKTQVIKQLNDQGVNTSDLTLEERYAKNPATGTALVLANTLLGPNGDKGALDQYLDATKAANVTSFKQVNEKYNSGQIDLGTTQGKALQKAHTLGVAAQDQYAKILVGTGMSTDDARKQAGKLFDSNFGSKTAEGAVEGAKAELNARLDSMGAQSRYVKHTIVNSQRPPQTIADKVPEGKGFKAANGSLWVKTNGELVPYKP